MKKGELKINHLKTNWGRIIMTVKSKITTDANGNIIVEMHGGFDYEHSQSLNYELAKIVQKHKASNIMLDLNNMDFVGSSGIGDFVETLRVLNRGSEKQIKLINVKSEFKRVFKLYNLEESFTFEAQTIMMEQIQEIQDQFENDDTEINGKNRTFEN